MPEKNNCPQCGTPLPFGALAGLCPACLLKMGAAADTVTDAKQPAFQPPTVAGLAPLFPQLEILGLVGKGGMGAVYKARQKQLDRIVALKILPPGIGDEPAFAERFAREAKALAKLNHPNIVTLYEFGDAGGQFYFLMEFVDGVNLRQLLHAGRISAREALAIVPQICDALQFAHDQGIVHRDIKPENILLDRRGRVKVADFGLAKIVGIDGRADLPVSHGGEAQQQQRPANELTDAGRVMGTPQYMSPEQMAAPGEVDHRADIYALGVVFYQMLTGELPGKQLEAPSKKVQIDVRLDEIVLRALEKNPELRYQQVSEVKTMVETIVATPPGSSGREFAQTEKPENGSQKPKGWFSQFVPFGTPLPTTGMSRILVFCLRLWAIVGVFLLYYGEKGGPSWKLWMSILPFLTLGILVDALIRVRKERMIEKNGGTGGAHAASQSPSRKISMAFVMLIFVTMMFFSNKHNSAPAIVLSQSEFLGKFQSNEIAHATIKFGRNAQLTPITGNYFKTDKNGKVTKAEVPFVAPNVLLTQKTLDELLASDKIEAGAPSGTWMNVIWSIAPFVILGVGTLIFILILAFIIRRVWRAVNQGSTGVPPGDSGSSRREEAQTEKAESGTQKAEIVPRFSLPAIVGACLPLLFFMPVMIFMPLLAMSGKHSEPATQKLFLLSLLLLGLPGLPVMTILGWVAVSQIRNSAGKLCGLWLAVFDGLLFPLLVVDGAIAWLWLVLAKLFARQVLGLQDSLFLDLWDLTIWVSLALASVALVDWLIIRRVWRAVNQPVAAPAPSVQKPDRFWRWFAVTVLGLIMLPIVIFVLSILMAIILPHFDKQPKAHTNAPRAAAPATSITTVYPGDWIWEMNSATLDRVPPIFLLRATTMPTNWVPGDMFGNGRYLARGQTLQNLITRVWSQKNSTLKIVFPAGLPEDKYDFIVAGDLRWWESLQTELDRRFNLVEQIENRDGTNVVMVKNISSMEPADLREARAKLAELRVDYADSNTVIQRMLARIKELERMMKEEPAAPADLREAKAHLAELRVDYAEQNPRVQEALARIKALEQNGSGPKYVAMIAVQGWLALVDAGAFGHSWETAADSFHDAITKDDWMKRLEQVRPPLGAVISRRVISTHSSATLPGMPDGSYFIAQFETAFAAEMHAVETVTFGLEKDGQWKAVAYLIRPRTAEQTAAVTAAQKWLAGIDGVNYAQSWLDASEYFQGAITQDKWVAALQSVRKPLGELKIRTVDSAVTETQLPGTPDGKYVVMQFDTAFANKNSATETVTFSLEADGVWKACGYYIK